MSALVLAVNGFKVLMLEAGRDYDPVTETPMFQLPSEAPLRGADTPDKPFGFFDATVDGGWRVPGEPYASADGVSFRWWRARMLGGRTNHWGRVSLRNGPYDFKTRTRRSCGQRPNPGCERRSQNSIADCGLCAARSALASPPNQSKKSCGHTAPLSVIQA